MSRLQFPVREPIPPPLAAMYGEVDPAPACDDCKKTFLTKRALRSHRRWCPELNRSSMASPEARAACEACQGKHCAHTCLNKQSQKQEGARKVVIKARYGDDVRRVAFSEKFADVKNTLSNLFSIREEDLKVQYKDDGEEWPSTSICDDADFTQAIAFFSGASGRGTNITVYLYVTSKKPMDDPVDAIIDFMVKSRKQREAKKEKKRNREEVPDAEISPVC